MEEPVYSLYSEDTSGNFSPQSDDRNKKAAPMGAAFLCHE